MSPDRTKNEDTNPYALSGLSTEEVLSIREKNPTWNEKNQAWREYLFLLWGIIAEPMFVLLAVCAGVYFILGEQSEAWFMGGAIIVVSTISFYQEIRQKNALDALKQYHKKGQKVIRDNLVQTVPTEELVIGDVAISAEGDLIAADGILLLNPDFSVNESLLTGESLPVYKDHFNPELSQVSQGSLVTSGQCLYRITALGHDTRLGRLGSKMDEMKFQKSPLQLEISTFVTRMALVGSGFFILICLITYLQSESWSASLLAGLTIAMSVLPEEIPVAYTTFMALGAWRLIREGIIVKKTDIVEALGSTHFLCLDKTGTITQNMMELTELYDYSHDIILSKEQFHEAEQLLEYAMWASEEDPFDTMEKSIHYWYDTAYSTDKKSTYKKIHEYPLGGIPPTMTHVFYNGEKHILAAMKGALEAVLNFSGMDEVIKEKIQSVAETMASKGYRVLGVAKALDIPEPLPQQQSGFSWQFLGLLAFYDPPKTNIHEFFNTMAQAGIQTKIITGDHLHTALQIAKDAGLQGKISGITEKDLEKMTPEEVRQSILENQIFARISPEWKLKIIQVLKETGIVAMTGDGVNDGLALKAAHVGIAMGKKGTEIAKLASSIILTDDNIDKIAVAVDMGRKIYANLQKAIRYIISIHVPIILIVSIPLFFAWPFASIFTPVHIIFLELLMGPTCSIVYENEPSEPGMMQKPPVERMSGFISLPKLGISIIQGLVITIFGLGVYQWGLAQGVGADYVRSLIFLMLVTANVVLTLTNRSFTHSLWSMLKIKNALLNYVLMITIVIMACIYFIPPIRSFFFLSMLQVQDAAISIGAGIISVLWFEIYKAFKRKSVPTVNK